MTVTDEPTITPAPSSDEDAEVLGEPTPEERIAETDSEDPDVGSDGTGLGELP